MALNLVATQQKSEEAAFFAYIQKCRRHPAFSAKN